MYAVYLQVTEIIYMVQLCYNTRKVVVAVNIAMARHWDMFGGVCMGNSRAGHHTRIRVLYGYQPSHLYTVYGTSAGTNGTVTVDLTAVRRVLWGYGMIQCVEKIQICASLSH